MRSVKLNYIEIGSICQIDKDAFDKFWSQLYKLGISVTYPKNKKPKCKTQRKETK